MSGIWKYLLTAAFVLAVMYVANRIEFIDTFISNAPDATGKKKYWL